MLVEQGPEVLTTLRGVTCIRPERLGPARWETSPEQVGGCPGPLSAAPSVGHAQRQGHAECRGQRGGPGSGGQAAPAEVLPPDF